jgi:hypothetical protein
MISRALISQLLTGQIRNAETQWSLGTFGGIAEFSRDPGEPVNLTTTEEKIAAVTERGGVAIHLVEDLRPFASESITKTNWSHRVALCLPRSTCAMSRRAVLTELGPDCDALRIEDRKNVLFDLGLDALQADLCVRFADETTVGKLREHAGRSVLEPGNPAMEIILSASPHRVFISRVGRIEVYQTIPPATGKSPDGPHTHVLPKLLKSRRTHPATEPIPDGWIPCAHLYPPHPARGGMGESRPFDATHHDSFQRMMEAFGRLASQAIKRRVMDAVNAGGPPSATTQDRHGRTSIRIALRQMQAARHASAVLPAWLASFDHAGWEGDEDEAALYHEG